MAVVRQIVRTVTPPEALKAAVAAPLGAPLSAATKVDLSPISGLSGPYALAIRLGLQSGLSPADAAIFFMPRTFALEGAKMAARIMAYYLFGDARPPYDGPGIYPGNRLPGEGPLPKSSAGPSESERVYCLPYSHFSSYQEVTDAQNKITQNFQSTTRTRMTAAFLNSDVDPLNRLSDYYWKKVRKTFRDVGALAEANAGTAIPFGYTRPVSSTRLVSEEDGFIDRVEILSGAAVMYGAALNGLNDLRAALGTSRMNAYMSGTCCFIPAKGSARAFWTFKVNGVGVRFRDQFDFSGLEQRFQPLGIFDAYKFYRLRDAPLGLLMDQNELRDAYQDDVAKRGKLVPVSYRPPKVDGSAVSLSNSTVLDFASRFKRIYNLAVETRGLSAKDSAELPRLECQEFTVGCTVKEVAVKAGDLLVTKS